MADKEYLQTLTKLFVGNLNLDVTEHELFEHFCRYGQIAEVCRARHHPRWRAYVCLGAASVLWQVPSLATGLGHCCCALDPRPREDRAVWAAFPSVTTPACLRTSKASTEANALAPNAFLAEWSERLSR